VVERTDPVVVLVARGEVDAANVADLAAALEAAVLDHERHVVLDASGIAFIDSNGITALVGGLRRLNRSRRRLALACGPATALGRALTTTGLDRTFEVHPETGAAVAALAKAPLIGR
jgi:anti-sigma B factor antagonist